MPRTVAVSLVVGAVLVGGALFVAARVGGGPDPAAETNATPAAAGVTLPPVDARFDYQIGDPYAPPSGVTVVSRDREADPAAGLYTICYVNAFQVQPHEVTWWQRNHDDLLLRDADSEYVVDGDWNEILLDISTAAKRTAIADIVNTWIDGCAANGFQAVDPGYSRGRDLVTVS
ncbi:endo alpha-1,4 polygalactosaminidase [Solwaraspora sp. WMMA2080]|nr:endo alpha-1,4 polygalactosaminidase [Solwaraspora sp. WMMA2080]WBC21221.1 endo alpha-1,4 polygalactosaminidase [Solwaraspora sp. WMMA2080]